MLFVSLVKCSLLILTWFTRIHMIRGQISLPAVLEVYPNSHLPGGFHQPGFTDSAGCISGCRALTTCTALDFDEDRGGGCWFHSVGTLCLELSVCETCTHYRLVACYLDTNVLGAELMPGIFDVTVCVAACTGDCMAVDFDFTAEMCWHHGQDTGCRSLQNKQSCNHYKRHQCQQDMLSPVLPLPPPAPAVPPPPSGTVVGAGGSGGSAGASDQDVIGTFQVNTDTHALGATIQPGVSDLASCLRGCGQPSCRAVDYDFTRQSCWYHSQGTSCSALQAKQDCAHFKMETCDVSETASKLEFQGQHAIGGMMQPTLRSRDSCVSACVLSVRCRAIDYNYGDRTCWFHYEQTSCSALMSRGCCDHIKLNTCDMSTGLPDDSVPDMPSEGVEDNTNTDGIIASEEEDDVVPSEEDPNTDDVTPTEEEDTDVDDITPTQESTDNDDITTTEESTDNDDITTTEESETTTEDVETETTESLAMRCGRPVIAPKQMSLAEAKIVGGLEANPHSWPWQMSAKVASIVGGSEARPHSWPWQVGLIMSNFLVCGGSLVTPQWVITAAHCFTGGSDPRLWRARLGEHSLRRHDDSQLDVNVKRIIMHPSYNSETQDHDVAMLELDTSVVYGDEISPVCLPEPRHTLNDGMICTVTGWGDTQENGVDGVLNQVSVPVVNQGVCNSRNYYNGILTDRMLCAGFKEGGRDTCQGDSGGPLVCTEDGGQQWTIVGITSFGEGCALRNRPGVYTRVSAIVDWILENLNA